jgi:uncharacterized repeat protein (TIGR03837 family)
MNLPPPSLQWDVFCRVIDNFGDIGVCWRLVTQLARQGQQVRLWVDDASALQWMAPQGCPGVEVRAWGAPVPTATQAPPDVMVEAFGCEITPEFIAYSAHQASTRGQKPVWINLEYLSAEGYVERNHRLPSPILSGPAAGWTRWFFYPGFTAATGGLLREPGLMERRALFDVDAWRAQHAPRMPGAPGSAGMPCGAPPAPVPARWISLFCYEPPALPQMLAQCAATPSHLLITPGRATQAVRETLGSTSDENSPPPLTVRHGQASVSYLPYCAQPQFDEMLWACDLNAVRGEDSLVRALWAGQALVWQIYPQHDNAHHDKLMAFLDWLQAPASMRRFHAAWNGLDPHTPLVMPDAATLAEWSDCVQAARAQLLMQDNLVAQLWRFVREKR